MRMQHGAERQIAPRRIYISFAETSLRANHGAIWRSFRLNFAATLCAYIDIHTLIARSVFPSLQKREGIFYRLHQVTGFFSE